MFNPSDTSAIAALAYAVNQLKVSHIVVVGHDQCGGCAAALSVASQAPSQSGPEDVGEAAIARWIEPLCNLATAQLKAKPNAGLGELVIANVRAQVANIVNHPVVTKAWARGQALSVDGWVYDISTGKLKDLGLSQTCPR